MKPRVLKSQTPEFKKFLAAILARRGGDSAGIDAAVSKIIADVRKRGDRALIDLHRQVRSREAHPRDAAGDAGGTAFRDQSHPG